MGKIRTILKRKLAYYLILLISFIVLTLGFNNCSSNFRAIEQPITEASALNSIPPIPADPPNTTPELPIVDVAVGTGGIRLSSSDQGKNWLYTSDGVLNNDCWAYRGIAYGNGVFVAVTGTGGFGRISTSPDGVHWREYEAARGSDGIGFGGGIFFTNSFVSTDGYNFTFRNVNVDTGKHEAFAYLNGHYFMTGALNGIAVSTDGSNFAITLPNYLSPDYNDYYSNIFQFAVGNGIVVGMAYSRLASTSDLGATWHNQDDFFGYGSAKPANPMQYNTFRSITFDGTQFVVYGGSGNYGQTPTTWKSTDGVSWTMATQTAAALLVGGDASTHFVAFPLSKQFTPANILSSFDLGKTWSGATSLKPSGFYDFSTTATPVADPTPSDFTGYGISRIISGKASSDPNKVPVLPPSVLLTHDQLAASACGNNIPAGR